MTAGLRSLIESSWYDDSGASKLLLPAAWLFGGLAALRRGAYKQGLFRQPLLPVPVIVVGNINVGGTGKTPVVSWLAQQLSAAGWQPGVVSRGYGGQIGKTPQLLESRDAVRYGDEPVLIARQAGCPVCVCTDRVAAVRRIAQAGVNIVISDDGLQHYRMRRAMEIVVVDGERGFGNGQLLPAGPLREPVSRATAADALVINGPATDMQGFSFQLEQLDAVLLGGDVHKPLAAFAGQRVWAVAGIGNPGRFSRQLHAAGIQVDEVSVADHGTVSLRDLLRQRQQPVLMTEKDAVKYPGQSFADVWYVPAKAAFSAADTQQLLTLLASRVEAFNKRS